MQVLVIFSSPPDQPRLRLDKEDRILSQIARAFHGESSIEKQHASEIDDINSLIMNGQFDVIHFSGHGHHHGICLERSHCKAGATEYVSAEHVVEILELASKPPLLTIFLSCYSDESCSVSCQVAQQLG